MEFDDEKESIQRRILRSLCTVGSSEDEREAIHQNSMVATETELGLAKGEYLDLLKKFIEWYTKYGGPPQANEVLKDLDREKNTKQAALLREVIREDYLQDTGYLHLLQSWREFKATRLLEETVWNANNILTVDGQQLTDSSGKTRHLKGPEQAIEYLHQNILIAQSQIDPLSKQRSAREILEKLQKDFQLKQQRNLPEIRMYTNIPQIDDNTNGGKPGELWTLAGFVGHGKTTLAINWVYQTLQDNLSTLFVSYEMPEEQVMNIFLTLHSFMLANDQDRVPLRYENFRDKTVASRDDEAFYWHVIEDFKTLTDDNRLIIVKPTSPMAIMDVRAKAEFHNRIRPLDMVVMDYLSLVAPDPNLKTKTKYDIINMNFMLAKRMAMEFDHGKGVFVLTPHQINRQGHRRAQEPARGRGGAPEDQQVREDLEGVYELDALADANEAERSSDAVLTIYQSLAMRQNKRGRMCFLKNRDGDRPSHWDVEYDGVYRFIGPIDEERERNYQRELINC